MSTSVRIIVGAWHRLRRVDGVLGRRIGRTARHDPPRRVDRRVLAGGVGHDGRDRDVGGYQRQGLPCPVALVLVAALSAASLLAVVADTRPLGAQFWPVGEAVVNIAIALALLSSPATAGQAP